MTNFWRVAGGGVALLALWGCGKPKVQPVTPRDGAVVINCPPSTACKDITQGSLEAATDHLAKQVQLNGDAMALEMRIAEVTDDCLRVDTDTWKQKHCDRRINKIKSDFKAIEARGEALKVKP